jgi:hypothetical protein
MSHPWGERLSFKSVTMEGWIKLHRRILQWEWFKNDNVFRIFLFLLLKANHQDSAWKGIDIQRGQLVTSRKTISVNTGISEQCVRTCLGYLKSTNEITIKSTKQFTIITINKYEDYQFDKNKTNQQTNQQTNKQLTTNKNDKEIKEEDSFSEFQKRKKIDEENLRRETEEFLKELMSEENS